MRIVFDKHLRQWNYVAMPEAASRQIDSSSGQLKICFIGNTNNYPYLVAHAMRRMGHDVTLLLDRPEGLHRPQGRYADLDLPTADTARATTV